MKRTVFDESRDLRIADEATDRTSKCAARNCPNAWTVDAGHGRLCSWHAWSEPHLWPRITQEQLDAQTTRALYAGAGRAPGHPLTRADKNGILAALLGLHTHAPGKAWAHELQQREKGGDRLSRMQREMWRCAVVTRREEEEGHAT